MNTSGSGAYRLSDNELSIEPIDGAHDPYPVCGRSLDVYRALSYARGHCLSEADLIYIVWKGYGANENVTIAIRRLRRLIAPDVIETVYGYGYIVRSHE